MPSVGQGTRSRKLAPVRGTLQLAEAGPALVVLDLSLPDASGFEVCRRLEGNPGLPVPFPSCKSQRRSPTRLSRARWRADAYLTDVAEPAVLLAAVRALLCMRRAEEASQAAARAGQATFDAISDGVFLLDKSGHIIRCNYAPADRRRAVGQRTFGPPGGGPAPAATRGRGAVRGMPRHSSTLNGRSPRGRPPLPADR